MRYHDRINVLQGLFATASHIPACSPFDRAEWLALLEKTGLIPLLALASENDVSAALALTEKSGAILPFRNWYNFTWRPLETDSKLSAPLLLKIASELKQRGSRVTLEPVPDEDGSATRLAQAFTAAGWRVEVTKCDTNHILRLNGETFEQYWASRPGTLRTTLKRKGKKVETKVYTHFDEDLWAQYEAIYAASWKPEEDHPKMLRDFAKAEGGAGRLRFGMAWLDDKPVAAQCWTIEAGTAFIHKLAYLESAQKLSPGTTLSAAMFKHVIDEDKVDLVDFGTGDQSYKADWMNDVRPRYRIDCIDMRHPRGWLDLARLTVGRLRAHDIPELAPAPPQR